MSNTCFVPACLLLVSRLLPGFVFIFFQDEFQGGQEEGEGLRRQERAGQGESGSFRFVLLFVVFFIFIFIFFQQQRRRRQGV